MLYLWFVSFKGTESWFIPVVVQGGEGPSVQGRQLWLLDVLPHQKEAVHGGFRPYTEKGESCGRLSVSRACRGVVCPGHPSLC